MRYKINDVVWVRGFIKPGIVESINYDEEGNIVSYMVDHYFPEDDNWGVEEYSEDMLSAYVPREEQLLTALKHGHVHFKPILVAIGEEGVDNCLRMAS